MLHDPQHRTVRAVAPQSPPAPLAAPASQVDLADDAAAHERARVRLHHLADELVSRRSAEAVVAALQFEIGVADARAQQPDQRVSRLPARLGPVPDFDETVLQVDGEHDTVHYNQGSCLLN